MFTAALFKEPKGRNNPNVQTDKWINTLWYIQLYIISHKAEESHDTCYNKDEPQKHYAEWKKPDTKGHRLYDSTDRKFP